MSQAYFCSNSDTPLLIDMGTQLPKQWLHCSHLEFPAYLLETGHDSLQCICWHDSPMSVASMVTIRCVHIFIPQPKTQRIDHTDHTNKCVCWLTWLTTLRFFQGCDDQTSFNAAKQGFRNPVVDSNHMVVRYCSAVIYKAPTINLHGNCWSKRIVFAFFSRNLSREVKEEFIGVTSATNRLRWGMYRLWMIRSTSR